MGNFMALTSNMQTPSYVTPLFWVRGGETEETLRGEICKLHENGIGGLIVESRPHEDFLGPSWWWMMDIILDEAEQRGMHVWVFDDKMYPSGRVNNLLPEQAPAYQKMYLRETHIDACGPKTGSSFLVKLWLEEGEHLVRAVAARRVDGVDQIDSATLMDVTDHLVDGVLYWDIPAGYWRVFLFISTRNGGEEGTAHYLNPLAPEPVRFYLDIVYEAHYAHYADHFGKTFAGFFSDEPRFGNAATYEARIGHYPMPLPYCDRLLTQLNAAWEGDFSRFLPCLWYEAGDTSARARQAYMQVVTRLYEKHFSRQIGDWCRAHGVKLMGHIVEDNGAHARLGYGPGHFYRAMAGYDYSGIDVVYQVWPEYTSGRVTTPFGYLDNDFFYWGLAKMATSYGHLDPGKAGTTVCEIFGAYGWQEGLKLMKWLTDHVCVRGVNVLIPHAISLQFPDQDCPPHFSGPGNPQWRFFHLWTQYANRVCHLLSGGQHVAPVAVLYHAEAEWSGAYDPFERAVKTLAQQQIDCDVLSIDQLLALETASYHDRKFTLHHETFDALIVPYAEYLPSACVRQLLTLADHGVPVIFLRDFPRECSDSAGDTAVCLAALRSQPSITVLAYSSLASTLRVYADVCVEGTEESLRYYHYVREDMDCYFFTNESTYQAVATSVRLRQHGEPVVYDALADTLTLPPYTTTADGVSFHLHLEPYESRFIIFPHGDSAQLREKAQQEVSVGYVDAKVLDVPWSVSIATAEQFPKFEWQAQITQLGNLAKPGLLPTFSGTIRYETALELPEYPPATRIRLDLGAVFEIAEVSVSGYLAGTRICPPYQFDITRWVTPGANRLTIDVTNTLVKQQGARWLDRAMPQEPSGLLGPVRLLIEEIAK